jgi:hypothetical protein
MSIANQMIAIRQALDGWAQREGGAAVIAQDVVHMWEIALNDQDSPRCIIAYAGEDTRGAFEVGDVLGMVDRKFDILVTRGRGYEVDPGDAIVGLDGGAAGMARPLVDLVEEARDAIRLLQLNDAASESPIYFRSIAPMDMDEKMLYAYLMEFTIGTHIQDTTALAN